MEIEKGVLRIENIYAGYGKKEVLKGISLTIHEGKIIALIGPNGAGKSTLLKVLAGFLKPWKGTIWFNGKEITPCVPHERAAVGVSYFMQGGKVFPSLSVKENLEIGSAILPSKERANKIIEMLEIFANLKELVKKRAGLLSGGERQALALAMILARNPAVLLLDEPSAGLAPWLVQDMLKKIKQINTLWGTTVLLVEQKIREALRIADVAVVLVSGKVTLKSDNPRDLLGGKELETIFMGK